MSDRPVGRLDTAATGNLREWALKLERFVETERDEEARDRARSQAKRARQLDELLRDTAAGDGTVRVIVVEGDMASEEQMGRESSVVRLRHLDPESWGIVSYDKLSGACLLHRGGPKEATTEPAANLAYDELLYEDQHGTPGTDTPPRAAVSGTAYLRDPAVRASVRTGAANIAMRLDSGRAKGVFIWKHITSFPFPKMERTGSGMSLRCARITTAKRIQESWLL